MFEAIIDRENIAGAYLDLVEKFEETARSSRYSGIDGLQLNDITATSSRILEQVREELMALKPIDPILEVTIPKKDGSDRAIFIYTVKDRIKAEAIYRVVEPIFEEHLSPFLFSYRSSHPHWAAVKSVARRYKKYYGEDTVLISDVSDYFGSIDLNVLRQKLYSLGLDERVIKLMDLFLESSILSGRKITHPKKGIILGLPISVLFANLYLSDVDQHVGKRVALYRRVGDDFILFDKDREKILAMKEYILKETKRLKLTIKEEKTKIIKSNEPFKFLGYSFSDGNIRIDPRTIRKYEIRWKKILRYYPISIDTKLERLPHLLYGNVRHIHNRDKEVQRIHRKDIQHIHYKGLQCIHNDFIQLLAMYRQLTDDTQIKQLSEKFFRLLTQYFFGSYSSRNQRFTKKLTTSLRIPSIYQYYLDFHHGRETLTSLSLSKKKYHKTRNKSLTSK